MQRQTKMRFTLKLALVVALGCVLAFAVPVGLSGNAPDVKSKPTLTARTTSAPALEEVAAMFHVAGRKGDRLAKIDDASSLPAHVWSEDGTTYAEQRMAE